MFKRMQRLDDLAAQRVLRTNCAKEDFLFFDTDEGPVNVVHVNVLHSNVLSPNDVESFTQFSV